MTATSPITVTPVEALAAASCLAAVVVMMRNDPAMLAALEQQAAAAGVGAFPFDSMAGLAVRLQAEALAALAAEAAPDAPTSRPPPATRIGGRPVRTVPQAAPDGSEAV